MSVLTARSFDGVPGPLATVGLVLNFVPDVTAGSGPSVVFGEGVPLADAVGEPDAEGDFEAAESLFLESSPQPAAVSMSAGTASRTERRRTESSFGSGVGDLHMGLPPHTLR